MPEFLELRIRRISGTKIKRGNLLCAHWKGCFGGLKGTRQDRYANVDPWANLRTEMCRIPGSAQLTWELSRQLVSMGMPTVLHIDTFDWLYEAELAVYYRQAVLYLVFSEIRL